MYFGEYPGDFDAVTFQMGGLVVRSKVTVERIVKNGWIVVEISRSVATTPATTNGILRFGENVRRGWRIVSSTAGRVEGYGARNVSLLVGVVRRGTVG